MATKPIPNVPYSQALRVPEAPNSYSVLVGQDEWQKGAERGSAFWRELRGGRQRHAEAECSAVDGLKFVLTLVLCYAASGKISPIGREERPLASRLLDGARHTIVTVWL